MNKQQGGQGEGCHEAIQQSRILRTRLSPTQNPLSAQHLDSEVKCLAVNVVTVHAKISPGSLASQERRGSWVIEGLPWGVESYCEFSPVGCPSASSAPPFGKLMPQPNRRTLTVKIKSNACSSTSLSLFFSFARYQLFTNCPLISCHRLPHLNARKSRACLVTREFSFIRDAILVEFITTS